MNTINTKQSEQQSARHHYIRTIFASFFGFLAIALIIVSIVVVWLNRTLTNTTQYVDAVAPLVTKPAVQNFVVDRATDVLLNNKNTTISDLASKLLSPDQTVGKTSDQLKAEVTPIISDSVRTIVSSPDFARLWADSNRNIQEQIMTQLTNSSASVTLNFHQLIVGVIDELGQTKLSFVQDKLDIKPDVGNVVINGKKLNTTRKVYKYFQEATLAVVGLALFLVILCVLISVHHLKTMRRVTLATGIFAGLLAGMLSATSLINTSSMDSDQKKMVITVFNTLTYQLRLSLVVICVVCVLVVIGSKLYPMLAARLRPTAKRA